MQKYQIIKKLGSGSFGHVEKAQNIATKQIVAIKKLKKKYGTWEQCLQLPQVKALRKMNHQNIIKLKQVVRVINQAYFVFEYIEKDLYQLIVQRKQQGGKLSTQEIIKLTKQLAHALQYIHKQGFFHRDLKPQNILISNDFTAKIIDFGIAKQIRSKPPFTEYVSTRWYRAPQLLVRFTSYSFPVDIWALGCLVAEMYLKKPLFMGNSEMDMLGKICSVIGSPTQENWPEGMKQATLKGINFPEYKQIPLGSVIPDCPNYALDFISQCLKWDPSKRITPKNMLNHEFLLKHLLDSQHQNLMKQYQRQNNPKEQQIRYKPIEKPKSYKDLDKDDQFDELLNNFDTFKIKENNEKQKGQFSPLKKQKQEDKEDDWF